ncbi:ribonuclease H-like domain-containing protein [Tanacetum coccineum]
MRGNTKLARSPKLSGKLELFKWHHHYVKHSNGEFLVEENSVVADQCEVESWSLSVDGRGFEETFVGDFDDHVGPKVTKTVNDHISVDIKSNLYRINLSQGGTKKIGNAKRDDEGHSDDSISAKVYCDNLESAIPDDKDNEFEGDGNSYQEFNDEFQRPILNRDRSKWVFKVKYKSSGEVERFNARLVAKGFHQKERIDYEETFSPVVKILVEDVYMKIPEGYLNKDDNRVCKLVKPLYGLKQAPRKWNEKLTSVLLENDFIQIKNDFLLFTKNKNGVFIAFFVYLDDIVLTGNNCDEIKKVKEFLSSKFLIKDLGKLKYFLGTVVLESKENLYLTQRKYCLEVLAEFSMLAYRPYGTPIKTKESTTKPKKIVVDSPLTSINNYQKLIDRRHEFGLLFRRIPRGGLGIEQNQFDSLVRIGSFCHIVPSADRWILGNLESTGPMLYYPGSTISSRGIDIQDMSVSICDNAIESTDHLFFRCGLVRGLANKVLSLVEFGHTNLTLIMQNRESWLLFTIRMVSKLKRCSSEFGTPFGG